jgi:hypothetical protein
VSETAAASTDHTIEFSRFWPSARDRSHYVRLIFLRLLRIFGPCFANPSTNLPCDPENHRKITVSKSGTNYTGMSKFRLSSFFRNRYDRASGYRRTQSNPHTCRSNRE